jgi:hypothetical protein
VNNAVEHINTCSSHTVTHINVDNTVTAKSMPVAERVLGGLREKKYFQIGVVEIEFPVIVHIYSRFRYVNGTIYTQLYIFLKSWLHNLNFNL